MQGSKKKELRRKRGTQKRKGLRKKSSDEKRGTPEMHGANKLTFDERRGTPETQGAKEGDVHIKNRMNTRWNERGGVCHESATWPRNTSQVAHNQCSLEDRYRIKSCK
jgi:hypothetical protein